MDKSVDSLEDEIPSIVPELQRGVLTNMMPFITGSHAYGQPGPDSDIDLVVFMDESVQNLLIDNTEQDDTASINSARFGKLNVLICTEYEQYKAWRYGTNDLIDYAMNGNTVTRDIAVAHFKMLRRKLKVNFEYGQQQ